MKRLLIVEPDLAFRRLLQQSVRGRADVDSTSDFAAARTRLFATSLDLVVTNLRLGAFNGLHLAYLLAGASRTPRLVVYTDHRDRSLADDIQHAGAFVELQRRLPYALPAYLDADLPPLDRRTSEQPDRRSSYRGGRRASDLAFPTDGSPRA